MRSSVQRRKTAETDIRLSLTLEGTGNGSSETGIGFFDHMLTAFAKHGLFDLRVTCEGDLYVDTHHTAEDVGIVLGDAIAEAVGDKEGIKRYGSAIVPMDEALVLCAIDLCGRPVFVPDLPFSVERIGELETEVIPEFFKAVSDHALMNLHLRVICGSNNHHIAEAAFKAFARALSEAVSIDPRITGVLSTKGSL